MRLLMIGGTRFIGREVVEEALATGWEVTLFHRGQVGRDLFDENPKVERIIGNRDGGLDALGDQTWDAVVDTCGYHPRVVRQSTEYLRGKVGFYNFISTVSVYSDKNEWPVSETRGNLNRFETMPESEEITGETYGAFKVLCEEVVQEAYPDRHAIVRPGLVVGPHDYSDRFTYWIDRLMRGGEALVPDCFDKELQFIDVRDLGRLTFKVTADRNVGVFIGNGPWPPIRFREFFDTLQRGCGGEATLVPVDEKWLVEQGVQPWSEIPLWMGPEAEGKAMQTDVSASMAAGLSFTPFEQTVRDTAAWHATRGEVGLKAGLSPERERELLEAWKQARVGA